MHLKFTTTSSAVIVYPIEKMFIAKYPEDSVARACSCEPNGPQWAITDTEFERLAHIMAPEQINPSAGAYQQKSAALL